MILAHFFLYIKFILNTLYNYNIIMQSYLQHNQYNTTIDQQINEQIKQFFENFLNTYEEL